jgi:hypothetical protein
MRRAVQILVGGCLLILALLVSSAVSADPPKDPPDAKKDGPEKGPGSDADEEYRRESKRVVDGISLEIKLEDEWFKVKRIEKPVLYYGDPTRDNDRGSVWAWGEKGRPVALLELWQHVDDRTRWAFCVCNTSGGKLRATRGGDPWWRENESACELKDVPDAPAPASDAAQRQRQMKQLAQKFKGHEFWDPNNSRFELRRLERPLHVYKDEDAGILDGALYTLANGTNPEIMVFIEARTNPKDTSKTAWQYTVGRLAHAELHLLYDDREVFEAPRGNKVSGATKPYWLGFLTTPSDPKPEK